VDLDSCCKVERLKLQEVSRGCFGTVDLAVEDSNWATGNTDLSLLGLVLGTASQVSDHSSCCEGSGIGRDGGGCWDLRGSSQMCG
jgi:hypothetical protein